MPESPTLFTGRGLLRALPMLLLLVVIVSLLVASLVTGGDAARSEPRLADPPPWLRALRTVDEELQRKNVSAAVVAWHEAYRAALGSRTWEGMVAVGDAHLRIGDASGTMETARARARENYLAAVYRARAAGSIDGVLRAAQAFQALGDRDVVLMCLRIADDIAILHADSAGRARVRAFAGASGQQSRMTP